MVYISLAPMALGALVGTAMASTGKRNSTIDWFPCSDLDARYGLVELNITCAFHEVPLNWADKSAGQAKLAVAMIPAAKERWGTMFVNPGGPANSGVDFIFENGPAVRDEVGGHYDVVSWDVRGGRGHTTPGPPACFNSSEESAKFFDGTLEGLGIDIKGNLSDDEQTDEFYSHVDEMDAKYRELGERCARAQSSLPYVGTAATARDLISLADRLDPGVQEINYWGISYGSLLGVTFVNMFPDRVGHVVLDACVDPDLWYNKPATDIYAANLASGDDTLAGFVNECASAGKSGCPLVQNSNDTGANIRERIQGLLDQAHDLRAAGADLSKTLTSAEFRIQILSAMFLPLTWSNFSTMAVAYGQSLEALAANKSVPGPISQQLTPLKYNVSATYEAAAIWCSDTVDAGNMTMRDGFDAIVDTSANVSAMLGPKWWFTPTLLCFAWPARAVERYTGPWNNKLKNRILVIGNTADPGTALKNAERMAELIGESAVLVKQNGYGHSSMAEKSTCIVNVIKQYFENGTLPEDNNTLCEIDDDVVLFPDIANSK
ncbi:TAP-like protein-domain-containing protein [Schizophyllum fasciatum]